jgi:hypothetical protein
MIDVQIVSTTRWKNKMQSCSDHKIYDQRSVIDRCCPNYGTFWIIFFDLHWIYSFFFLIHISQPSIFTIIYFLFPLFQNFHFSWPPFHLVSFSSQPMFNFPRFHHAYLIPFTFIVLARFSSLPSHIPSIILGLEPPKCNYHQC